MPELCHRCHGELPQRATHDLRSQDDALLFCGRCGAPQLLLPEHMRLEVSVPDTTGAQPPPLPGKFSDAGAGMRAQRIDWRAALSAAALVAAVAAVLALASLKFSLATFLSVLWVMSGAGTAIGIYLRRSPRSRLDARAGARIGMATGLLMMAAISIALAATGVVMRFGTRSLGSLDAQQTQVAAATEKQFTQLFNLRNDDKEVQLIHTMLSAPEFRAASALGDLAVWGGVLLILSVAGGALAGMLRGRQQALRQGS